MSLFVLGQLTTMDGQLLHQSPSGILTLASSHHSSESRVAMLPAPVIFSHAPQIEVTVSSSDPVSSMIHNVQHAAAETMVAVHNGGDAQTDTE